MATTAWVALGSALLSLYVLSLPLLAQWADRNADRRLCNTRVECTDGGSFFWRTGSALGCGCGQGILGQSACPVGIWGYTVSGYIATAPGTGAMAALSAAPIAAVWQFGTGSPRFLQTARVWRSFEEPVPPPAWLLRVAHGSLLGFTVLYGVFLLCTLCIFEELHTAAVNLFACCAILHWWSVFHIYSVYYHEKEGARLVAGLSMVVVLGFGGFLQSGYLYQSAGLREGLWSHLPWACECVALTAGFAIAPVMLWYDSPPRHGTQLPAGY